MDLPVAGGVAIVVPIPPHRSPPNFDIPRILLIFSTDNQVDKRL